MKAPMKRLLTATAVIGAGLLLPQLARAQSSGSGLTSESGLKSVGGEPTVTSNAQVSATAASNESNPGVKISDEAILHVGVNTSVGYDSNVFYNDSKKVESPILEVTPTFNLSNGDRGGGRAPEIHYELGGSLQYREYLTDDKAAKAQRAFNPSAGATLETAQDTTVGFALTDTFIRQQEPPFLPADTNITRDSNLATARLRLSPGGGRLAMSLQYSNSLQLFENEELKYGNVMGHEGVLDVTWKWLPKTAVFIQIAQGAINYLNTDLAAKNNRHKSYPFKGILGLRGLISRKVAMNAGVGYAAGNYQDVTGPSGLSNLAGAIDLTYSATATTALGLGYKHEFQNSPIIGNYYDSDATYVQLRQSIASRVIFGASVRYENRRYRGFVDPGTKMDADRKDNMFSAGAVVDWFIQKWLYAGASYSLSLNRVKQTLPINADYTKHLVFARVGVAY
jgi:hypothetical protein